MERRINLDSYAGMEFDPNELIFNLRRSRIFWCFGASQFVHKEKLSLRFKVNGLLHQGLVFIRLNSNDYFDVAITDIEGIVIEDVTDVAIDMLLGVLDNLIEKKA